MDKTALRAVLSIMDIKIYFPALKEYLIACFGQPSTQLPHKMHSLCSILPAWTMPFTSRLIGQLVVQVLQFEQFSGAARRRRLGQAAVLRSLRPKIMNGAIQQME